MKRCTKCGDEKTLDDFPWKSKTNNIKNNMCKVCYREYGNKYYKQVDREKQINRATANVKKVVDQYRDWKSQQHCLVCGEDSPECLDLHHLDPSVKDLNPSAAKFYGRKKLNEEIKKCVIVCANCHRKIHSKRINLPCLADPVTSLLNL